MKSETNNIRSKKLYRPLDNRMLAGVSVGIGNYFAIDPTIIRAFFVIFMLMVGSGILLYILLWIIIPRENRLS